MSIRIDAASAANAADANMLDLAFQVDSRLLLSATPAGISYEVIPVQPYLKTYPADGERVPADYLDNADSAAFLAYADDSPAGMILLSTGWNGLAVIDDIAISSALRRRGIGAALIAQAKEWARQRGLPGIMLETQDNNVAACRLYERCGFVLKGFDRALYAAQDGVAAETALFWYYFES
ncbi:GNAT family N-acetyltransferase [Pseudoduganella violacea]|uniref:Ribosomal protein S18 acetylase RimI-like enzyme n=1 Tax=Pseudoduganella violacea TaxID=1715466 RepID=A0A7W5FVY1_9BURK|nr:GNAT family N-acetyltransferase [Pseudoduganella violacea]MBB3121460.1 ribosomal protein S18 acetylase RimI-like enzyme [Pseudoduganella violacea]